MLKPAVVVVHSVVCAEVQVTVSMRHVKGGTLFPAAMTINRRKCFCSLSLPRWSGLSEIKERLEGVFGLQGFLQKTAVRGRDKDSVMTVGNTKTRTIF